MMTLACFWFAEVTLPRDRPIKWLYLPLDYEERSGLCLLYAIWELRKEGA
jgi:hypothetical protein